MSIYSLKTYVSSTRLVGSTPEKEESVRYWIDGGVNQLCRGLGWYVLRFSYPAGFMMMFREGPLALVGFTMFPRALDPSNRRSDHVFICDESTSVTIAWIGEGFPYTFPPFHNSHWQHPPLLPPLPTSSSFSSAYFADSLAPGHFLGTDSRRWKEEPDVKILFTSPPFSSFPENPSSGCCFTFSMGKFELPSAQFGHHSQSYGNDSSLGYSYKIYLYMPTQYETQLPILQHTHPFAILLKTFPSIDDACPNRFQTLW